MYVLLFSLEKLITN